MFLIIKTIKIDWRTSSLNTIKRMKKMKENSTLWIRAIKNGKRRGRGLLCLGCLLGSTFVLSSKVAAQSSQSVINPVADTWVRSTGGDKDTNYGSDSVFLTRHSSGGYIEIGFLRFDLSTFTLPQGSVMDSAKLFMTMVYNQSAGGVVNILPMDDQNDGWDENTITWNSGRPDTVSGAAAIASIPVAKLSPEVTSTSGITYNWNITSQVQSEMSDSNKLLSVAVYPDYKTDLNVKFLSKESAVESLRPRLVIYSHVVNPNAFLEGAYSDSYNNRIQISWQSSNSGNIAYFNVLHSTDGENFTTLAHVNTRSSTEDSLTYLYNHNQPEQNITHYYRIESVLKDSSHNLAQIFSAPYGVTGMVSRNVWEFTQVPSIAVTRDRLMQSLEMADYNPLALRVEAGMPFTLNLELLGGTDLPTLIVGTYDRQTVKEYPLTAGVNTITSATDGDLYIRFSSDNYSPQNKIKLTFQSGYKTMPLYILGNTTHQEWLSQLAADTVSPEVTLISKRIFVVTSRASAVKYQDKNQDTLLTNFDLIMKQEDDISGLDNSSPVHSPAYQNKLMLVEKVASGNPDATTKGRVRLSTSGVNWLLDPGFIADGGWGIFHEMGHHHQQYPWSWKDCTEVTVNIYSMAAQRYFHPGAQGMASSDWDKTIAYLEDTSSVKNYNGSENYVKLGLWNQFQVAYGDSFYHAIHKMTREQKIVPNGDSAEVRLLMLYASQISGQDLTTFFKKWNLQVNPSVYQEIAALNLPKPATDPSELREDWAVRISREGNPDDVDSVTLNGYAYGPEGIKKVEFYADGVKIGESSERPFRFAWKNVPFGTHSMVLKAIGVDDTIVSSEPVSIIQRAVSITYPANNSSLLKGSDVDIQATTAPGIAIDKVAFYDGTNKLGESSTAPYHFNWVSPDSGIHDLTARVIYDGGEGSSGHIGTIVGAYFAEADGYVRDGGSATTNFGLDTVLVVKTDNNPYNRISYLRFNVANLSGVTDSMRLNLNIFSANSSVSKTQWELWLCDSIEWAENRLTWANRPATDSLLGTIDTKKTGTVSWTMPGDIRQLMDSNGYITLAVVSTTINGTSDVSFYSRDAAQINLRPQLEVFSSTQSLSAVLVTYTPLRARLQQNKVSVSWQTYTEVGTEGFIVEHSTDGQYFTALGQMGPQGNTPSSHLYEYIDENPAAGLNYYRFKELSQGGIQYSNVAAVNYNFLGNSPLNIYPNPVRKGAIVTLALPRSSAGNAANQTYLVKVVDVNGRLVDQNKVIYTGTGELHLSISTAKLVAGIYFVQLQPVRQVSGTSDNLPTQRTYKAVKLIVH